MPACKISDGICQRCQDFIDAPPRQRLPEDIPLDWHTISALQSCSQHCKLCDFMLRIIHAELDPDRLAKLSTIQIYRNHEGRGNIVLLIPKKEPGGGLKHRELDSIVHGIIGKPTTPSTSHEATSDHTGSDETVSRIQTWLQACEQHIPCRQWRDQYGKKFLPTRLLQVDHEVRLVDAAEVTDPRYTALSYCWGPKQGIQLLRNKVESHRRSIPFDDLPATFKDAIDLVRRLGLRYIWIDALCIVQDNEQDWIAESPLMDQIYLHAHICIAATASDRSDKGLYRSRNPSLVRSVVVPTSTGAQTIFMNRQHWEVRKSPLSSRSWIIQERFMATRTVHFAGSQVFWECHQGCTSESFAPGSYELNLHFPDRKALVIKTWHELAHDYTKGSLTYDTDRPVAISALSRLFSKALSCNYLHGIWEPQLRDDLTWQATHDGNPKRRSENVPTWSWLSINNASITWQDTEPKFDIAIAGDSLRLRARLCQIWLTFATNPNSNELNKKPLHIILEGGKAHYAGHFFVDDLHSLKWLHESSARRRCCYLIQACEGKTDIGVVLRNESAGKFTRLGQMAWNWGTLKLEYRRSRPAPNAGDRFVGEAALVSKATIITAKMYRKHFLHSIIPESVCSLPDSEHCYTFELA